MMRLLPLLFFCVACTTQDESPISSKVTLDGRTWTAAAFALDEASPQDVTIQLVKEGADRAECGGTVFDMVEMGC